MKIDEEDFKSFISIKQSLDVNSVRLCVIRVRVINRWFTDKELTKENIEKFFRELQLSGRGIILLIVIILSLVIFVIILKIGVGLQISLMVLSLLKKLKQP